MRPRPQRRRSASSAETTVAHPTKALSAGLGPAVDAARLTAAGRGQRNRYTQPPRPTQNRRPEQRLSLTFPKRCTAPRPTG